MIDHLHDVVGDHGRRKPSNVARVHEDNAIPRGRLGWHRHAESIKHKSGLRVGDAGEPSDR
jgi:hypothetical protein